MGHYDQPPFAFKVPTIYVIIKDIRFRADKRAAVIFKDPTNEIKGTIFLDNAFENLRNELKAGTAMVLNDVTVLKFSSSRIHYLMVTHRNIIHIFTSSSNASEDRKGKKRVSDSSTTVSSSSSTASTANENVNANVANSAQSSVALPFNNGNSSRQEPHQQQPRPQEAPGPAMPAQQQPQPQPQPPKPTKSSLFAGLGAPQSMNNKRKSSEKEHPQPKPTKTRAKPSLLSSKPTLQDSQATNADDYEYGFVRIERNENVLLDDLEDEEVGNPAFGLARQQNEDTWADLEVDDDVLPNEPVIQQQLNRTVSSEDIFGTIPPDFRFEEDEADGARAENINQFGRQDTELVVEPIEEFYQNNDVEAVNEEVVLPIIDNDEGDHGVLFAGDVSADIGDMADLDALLEGIDEDWE